ncbi:VanZ family protein [Oceanobacillus profundus]|uniref:VanZ family protein n=1 Tax=Oceanobacillus profundus TaxID=372463 RepID=UPI00203DE6AE|nr:VanZ family protein [Oceanobacillus profundus]
MHLTINIAFFGTILILLYIVIDLIRNKGRNLLRKFIFYTFMFYFVYVLQLTMGGITIPPLEARMIKVQWIPFFFVNDWVMHYQANGLDFFFWNSVKLTFYNLIMIVPFGVYLALLFQVKQISKAALMIVILSLAIEVFQLILSYFGVIWARGFDVDDILLNTFGGVIGFMCMRVAMRFRRRIQHKY